MLQSRRKSYQRPRRNRKRVNFSDYETDSEPEVENEKRRKKPTRPDVETTEEFQKFVTEFNSMCDEVDQFEVIIEKVPNSANA